MRRVIHVTLSMTLIEHLDFGSIAEQNESHEELTGRELRDELFTIFRTALNSPEKNWEDLLQIQVQRTEEHPWYPSNGGHEDEEENDEWVSEDLIVDDAEEDEEEEDWAPRVILLNPQENETSSQEVRTDGWTHL